MREDIEFKELSFNDINGNLLGNFNRYQKVSKYWYNENGNWALIEGEYIVDWDNDKKIMIINDIFANILKENKGYIFGAYDGQKLIGFSVLMNKKFGINGQYIQLKFLHVSNGYRHKGIGKILFNLCVERSKKIGIKKIYISANDSEETQKFYLGIGCKDAEEINLKLFEEEPYDRQMEYNIE
jgi:ribosomal protein S18 acetylase RimI-like enzyme